MSMVLWTNCLINDEVNSEEQDYHYLNKYLDKLDKICQRVSVMKISEMLDTTDAKGNFDALGSNDFSDTNELMAKNGVWVESSDALDSVQKLVSESLKNLLWFFHLLVKQ